MDKRIFYIIVFIGFISVSICSLEVARAENMSEEELSFDLSDYLEYSSDLNVFTYDSQKCYEDYCYYWEASGLGGESRSNNPPPEVQQLIDDVLNHSAVLLNNPSTRASVNNVSQAQWNSNLRWYTGRD